MTFTPSIQPMSQDGAGRLPAVVPVLALLGEVFCRWQIRRSLGRLSDADLRDIGLSRADLASALALPLARRAADALAHAVSSPDTRW